MNQTISQTGIDTALANLDFRSGNSLKKRLMDMVKAHHDQHPSDGNDAAIPADRLIQMIWPGEISPARMQSRRKNIHSIRSSINADLEMLYQTGKNPEGIIINEDFAFDMCDAARNKMLAEFTAMARGGTGVSLDKIADVLGVVQDILTQFKENRDLEADDTLSKIREMLDGMTGAMEIPAHQVQVPEDSVSENDTSTAVVSEDDILEIDEDDDIQEIDEDDIGYAPDNVDDLQEVDEDLLAALQNREIQAVDDNAIGADDDSDRHNKTAADDETDSLTTIEPDIETIDEDELIEIDDELDGFADQDKDTDTGNTDADTEDDNLETVEAIEEEDIFELDEGGDIQEIDEDDIGHAPDDEEDLQEVDEDLLRALENQEILEVDESDLPTGDKPDPDTHSGAVDDETDGSTTIDPDIDIINEDELVEIDDDLESRADQTEGDGTEDADTDTGDSDLETIEALDEADLLEVDEEDEIQEVDEDEIGRAPDNEDDLQEVDEDLLAALENQDIVEIDGEDIDEIDEDQWLQAMGALAQPSGETGQQEKKSLSDAFEQLLGAIDKHFNQLIHIPSGTYLIGSKEPLHNDLPEQRVQLPGFYMNRFPITNNLFEVFVDKTGYRTTAEKLGYGFVYHGRFRTSVDKTSGRATSIWQAANKREKIKGACWHQPNGPGSSLHNKRNHPVVQVSLEDAMAFAAWTGKRLPSEFEWEGAARTQKGHNLPWGDFWQKHMCNIETTAVADTTPVDNYPSSRNASGLEDTLGNVLEWTADECKPVRARIDNMRYHIAKGGSFLSPVTIRLSARFMLQTRFTANILGFRCVADS
ncbi:MAG: SUMF1/EgtB/PvdO family nonheme iron enzyme [Thermodesulfobacteriota bacterium]|nr:SUMF1/EgtB/PvdO family nonheme iron enzyme [Thermodesulfobacteriota bacterium]